MPAAEGFAYQTRKSGELAISHHHRVVTRMRGIKAAKLLARLETASGQEQQDLLARATGNYKRGNERR